MNSYELPIVEGAIEYNIDIGQRWGDMPNDLITSKFEETDIGDDESSYDDYARTTLTDRRSDTNAFAHEEPRPRADSSKSYLNLIHYGHRGNADPAAHPEMFIGFGGEEAVDLRGANDIPDFKKLKDQHNARMRFVPWDAEGDQSITGGGRSESQEIADRQKVYKLTKERFKQFSTSKDCRREGIRRAFKHNSDLNKTIHAKTFGEYITDKALNPQRRTTILSNGLIRNSKWYHLNTTDHEFSVARYGESGRRRLTKVTANHQNMTAQDAEFKSSDETKCFKNVGILMSEIVAAKRDLHDAKHDTEFSHHTNSQIRKHEQISKDLALILREMTEDSDFKSSDNSMIIKTAAPQRNEHTKRVVSMNHSLPAAHYLNAELMYKAVKPGADTRKIKEEMIRDNNHTGIEDVKTIFGKSARKDTLTGNFEGFIEVNGESLNVVNYKHVKRAISDERAKLQSNESFGKESDKTHDRKSLHTNYRVTSADDVINNAKGFHENLSGERLIAPMGIKSAVRRYQDRDMASNEISAMS